MNILTEYSLIYKIKLLKIIKAWVIMHLYRPDILCKLSPHRIALTEVLSTIHVRYDSLIPNETSTQLSCECLRTGFKPS